MKYITKDVCARTIDFDVEEGIVKNVVFNGGCDGNQIGISNLVEGKTVNEVVEKLKGIDCRGRGTSCPDQLARALEELI